MEKISVGTVVGYRLSIYDPIRLYEITAIDEKKGVASGVIIHNMPNDTTNPEWFMDIKTSEITITLKTLKIVGSRGNYVDVIRDVEATRQRQYDAIYNAQERRRKLVEERKSRIEKLKEINPPFGSWNFVYLREPANYESVTLESDDKKICSVGLWSLSKVFYHIIFHVERKSENAVRVVATLIPSPNHNPENAKPVTNMEATGENFKAALFEILADLR